ncbi:hypothetical protein SAMN05428981_103241 [Bacillus sp. OV194]|nr:hypothetical protein SAMN05428981_103241 [Bacillus sp. OV194]
MLVKLEEQQLAEVLGDTSQLAGFLGLAAGHLEMAETAGLPVRPEMMETEIAFRSNSLNSLSVLPYHPMPPCPVCIGIGLQTVKYLPGFAPPNSGYGRERRDSMPRVRNGVKGILVAFLIREGKKRVLPYVLRKIKNRHNKR